MERRDAEKDRRRRRPFPETLRNGVSVFSLIVCFSSAGANGAGSNDVGVGVGGMGGARVGIPSSAVSWPVAVIESKKKKESTRILF